MNKELQELINLPRHWMRETHNNELPYALELQEALSRCNLTADADVPARDFFTYMAGKDKGNGTYSYEDVRGAWQACEKWMEAKIEELENWKRQQLEVEAQLDAQRLAKLLGAKLGESCHAAINREVPKLVEELQRVRPLADCYQRVCDNLGIENGILSHIKSLRAELETLRTLLKRARVHMTNTRYNLPRIGMEEICADIDKVLSPPPDPFTTWRQRYMPNSRDDLAREAWDAILKTRP